MPSTAQSGNTQIKAKTQNPFIPHVEDGFIPIATIVERLVKNAYSELDELRETMPSMSNLKRKRKLLDYTQRFKQEFIKLFVLVQWASVASEVHICIDVCAFLQGQKNCFYNLYDVLRRDIYNQMQFAKMPGPDIPAAVDVLITGSFPRLWRSDTFKTFSVPPPLNATEVKSTLQTLNSLLSIRLLLYETVPYPMRAYSIQDGRATFVVPNEFTVQLSFADEEISKENLQWFLVDFDWNFSHAEKATEKLKREMEAVGNEILGRSVFDKKESLTELYNMLHDMSITYKFELLNRETSRLSRRRWANFISVRMDVPRRVLSIAYWRTLKTTNAEGSSSLEVLVEDRPMLAKVKALAGRRIGLQYATSTMIVHWRKDGQTLEADLPFNCDIGQLSASELISTIVATHATDRISAMYDSLLATGMTQAQAQIHRPDDRSEPAFLSLRLTSSKTLLVKIDCVTGRFVLKGDSSTQRTPMFSDCEKSINLQSGSAADRLVTLRYNLIQQEIEIKARACYWDVLKFPTGSLDKDQYQKAFKTRTTHSIFLCREKEGWKNITGGSAWFVVCNLEEGSTRWWIAELAVTTERAAIMWNIPWCDQIVFPSSLELQLTNFSIEFDFFSRLYRYSVTRIVTLQISRGLTGRNIKYAYAPDDKSAWTGMTIPLLTFLSKEVVSTSSQWASDGVIIRLGPISDTNSDNDLSISCKAKARDGLKAKFMGPEEEAGITIDPTSLDINVSLTSNVAASPDQVIAQFLHRWRTLESIFTVVDTASRCEQLLSIEYFSLKSLRVSYGTCRTLYLDIHRGDDVSGAYTMDIGSHGGRNPHSRVGGFLESLITEYRGDMRVLAEVLHITKPLLTLFDALERQEIKNPTFYVLARSAIRYRVYYTKLSGSLQIDLLRGPDVVTDAGRRTSLRNLAVWSISDAALVSAIGQADRMQKTDSRPNGGTVQESMRLQPLSSCRNIWLEGLDLGNETINSKIVPLTYGLTCTTDVLREVLQKLHNTITASAP